MSAKKAEYKLSVEDVADILSRTLALAIEAGLVVGVRNAEANAKRPAGLMIYIANLRTDGSGAVLPQTEPAAQNGVVEPPPEKVTT